MIKDKQLKIISLAFILVLTLLSFVNAGGCCFDSSNGKCSLNAESTSCSNGEFFSSASCSTSKCDKACCIMGSDTRYITARECQILSNSFGFSYPANWQSMESSDCTALSDTITEGACVSGDEYERDCKYETAAECSSGEFYAGSFCTTASLNTTCTSTTKTMCYDENVYGKDSCGNPDGLKSTCDYESGYICEQKNNTKASCKDLNCNDVGKKNGESWCVFGNSAEAATTPPEGEPAVTVGSRYFKQICVNGQVETEPCADFRLETCVASEGGEAKCENNPWQECLAANTGEADPATGSKVDEEACDPEFCKLWTSDDQGNCVETGGNFYCCSGDESECYKSDAEGSLKGESVTLRSIVESVNSNGGRHFTGNADLLRDLHLELCVPKVAGGLQFYSKSSSSSSSSSSKGSATTACSAGNFEESIYLDHDKDDCNRWRIKSWENPNEYVNVPDGKWGKVALINSNKADWQQDNCEENGLVATEISSGIPGVGSISGVNVVTPGNGSIPDSIVLQLLRTRCNAIADCGSKSSWIGGSGQELKDYTFSCVAGGEGDHLKCTLKYTCKQWKAPTGGECEKCNEENSGLPCSEYRCKSLGSCDYYEPDGIDTGYCMSSSDNSGPVIQSATLNPVSPLKPYTPVEITLTTDEASSCKFNLNKAGAKFDDMDYDFGTEYATEHKITLTLPGQTSGLDENTIEYDLITKDGKYVLYVRCIDPAGNGQTKAAYPINFEVMTYPDASAPTLSNFKPISGSRIKYNTTEKTISFEMNEPAQCKWELQETYKMDLMNHSFTCSESINVDPSEKYKCTGKLTNVSLGYENETTFYIGCKDQPWIANGSIITGGVNYSRNEMQNSYTYKLRGSEKFYISEISPSGLFEVSATNLNITLTVMTEGGAFSGKANCSWRQANTTEALGAISNTFTPFKTTGDSTSTQTITSPYIGENYFEVKCQDASENEARINTSINLVIDDGAPFINRLYKFSSKLKFKTEEDSICYYSFDRVLNCLFDINNASLMEGLYSPEHETTWIDDKTYYVKCKDIFGNYDAGCNKIIRTY